jgi:hypothetical protein
LKRQDRRDQGATTLMRVSDTTNAYKRRNTLRRSNDELVVGGDRLRWDRCPPRALRRLDGYFLWTPPIGSPNPLKPWINRDESPGARIFAPPHDVTTMYFPGPDNVAHGIGARSDNLYPNWPRGTVGDVQNPLPSILRQFANVTDRRFGYLLGHLERCGYLRAVLFALTADHGLIAFHNDDRHNLMVEDENGLELGRLFDSAVPGHLPGMDLWRAQQQQIGQVEVVYSPNGGMAHVYVRGMGEWTQAPVQLDVEAVAHALLDEARGRTPQVVADLLEALGNEPAIFVRTDGQGSFAFSNDYLWLRVVNPATGERDYEPIENFVSSRGLAAVWPEFEARLNGELNDRSPVGSRTGDIVLVTDSANGFLTVLPVDGYPGWHGGASRAESEVPLIFNMVGVLDKSFIQNAIPAGQLRNWNLSTIIRDVVDTVRD